MKPKWIVNVKGKPNSSFEISVLLETNKHGIFSYGWVGKDKLYVSGSGGPCNYTVCEPVFKCLIHTAELLADWLNKGGDIKDSSTFLLQ